MNVLRVALLAAAAATDVVFVHVGKTCGGSAISFLRRSTNVTEVHLRPVDLVDVADASQIVVSVRDPVQRVLSAFDWHRPGNNRTFGRCVHRKRNDDGGVCADAELYKCAATADAFADLVLLRNGTDRCALLAKAFLSSDAGAKLLGAPLRFARLSHINRGAAYYLETHLLQWMRKKRVWVINSDTCEADARAFLEKRHLKAGRTFPTTHASGQPHELEHRRKAALTDALAHEYRTLKALAALARNVDLDARRRLPAWAFPQGRAVLRSGPGATYAAGAVRARVRAKRGVSLGPYFTTRPRGTRA